MRENRSYGKWTETLSIDIVFRLHLHRHYLIIHLQDKFHFCRLGKEGSYLVGGETGDATAYAGDEELLVGMA